MTVSQATVAKNLKLVMITQISTSAIISAVLCGRQPTPGPPPVQVLVVSSSSTSPVSRHSAPDALAGSAPRAPPRPAPARGLPPRARVPARARARSIARPTGYPGLQSDSDPTVAREVFSRVLRWDVLDTALVIGSE